MLFTGVFTPFTPNVIIAKIDENFGFGTYTMLHLLWFSLCLFYSEFLEIIDSFQEFFSSNRSYFFHCFFFFSTFFLCFGTSIVQILLVCLMSHSSWRALFCQSFPFCSSEWIISIDLFSASLKFLFCHFKSTFEQI